MTEGDYGKAFQAKWGAKCVACGGKFPRGAWIVSRGKGQGAMHESCAQLAAGVEVELEEDNAATRAAAANQGARDRARVGRYGPIGDWADDSSSITAEVMADMRARVAEGAEALANRQPLEIERHVDPQTAAQFDYLRRCLEKGRALRAGRPLE